MYTQSNPDLLMDGQPQLAASFPVRPIGNSSHQFLVELDSSEQEIWRHLPSAAPEKIEHD